MQQLQLTIPAQVAQQTGAKTNPRELRSWLDDLPFLDGDRTVRLVRTQLRMMNRMSLAASRRLDLLELFLNTYQKLNEAHGAHPEISVQVKNFCQDIGFGYKIATHDLVNRPHGFLEARQLPLALLGAIYLLGLQLQDCYSNYRRAPRSLWAECLALYNYAWRNEKEDFAAPLGTFGEQQIDRVFRLVALLHLTDPYRLPQGMAGALRLYFSQRIDLCRAQSEKTEDEVHLALLESRQRTEAARPQSYLYLEIDTLLARMRQDVDTLERQGRAASLGLPAETPVPALLRSLRQTLRYWQSQQSRGSERQQTQARIEVVCGLDAVYSVVNGGHCFDPACFSDPEQAQSIDLGAVAITTAAQEPPAPFCCDGINHSNGGLALRYCGRLAQRPQVGQLLALRRTGRGNAGWVVAVCRWLIQGDDNRGFDMGLQYLTREPRPAAIHTLDAQGGAFHAAIAALQKRGDTRLHTLIARSGSLLAGNRIVIYEQGRRQTVVCTERLEAGPSFERFVYHSSGTK